MRLAALRCRAMTLWHESARAQARGHMTERQRSHRRLRGTELSSAVITPGSREAMEAARKSAWLRMRMPVARPAPHQSVGA